MNLFGSFFGRSLFDIPFNPGYGQALQQQRLAMEANNNFNHNAFILIVPSVLKKLSVDEKWR